MSEKHAHAVQDMYKAFGRGDVKAILDHLADDVDWAFNVAASDVPWHEPIKGKANIPRFFASLGHVDMKVFQPREMIHSGDHVITHIHLEYVVKKTGKAVNMEQLHWWTFNSQMKVSRMRHYEDTAQVLKAWHS